jgi:hypothetical protein
MPGSLSGTAERFRGFARGRPDRAGLLVFVLSLFVGAVLLAFPPGWLALALCAGVVFVIATWRRPVIGVGFILGATVLFEQYEFASFRPITLRVPFHQNIPGVPLTPLELLLAVVGGIVLVQAVFRVRRVRPNRLAVPVCIFLATLGVWVPYSVLSGGALSVVVWEVTCLVYFCLLALIVPQAIESRTDVHGLLWVVIAAVAVKAAQGVWNYAVVLGGDLSRTRAVTGHEDALFMAWIAILLVGLLLYGAAPRQRKVLLAVCPLMLVAFVVTDRRAAYAALAIGLVVLAALVATDRTRRLTILKWGVSILLVAGLVVALGWKDPGILGGPARTVQSIVAPTTTTDIESSFYRDAEETNLMEAVVSNPILGLGFGRPFQDPGEGGLGYLGLDFENIVPHNEIFGLWAKMGTVGFALFWVLIGGVIAFGAMVFRTSGEPYTKAIAAFVTAAVAMQMTVSFVDLQLTYARNMVFLGVLVGILSRLPALAQTDRPTKPCRSGRSSRSQGDAGVT